jgi:putative transposase
MRLFAFFRLLGKCLLFCGMKLTAQIRLNATPEQRSALVQTMQRANAACDAISAEAFEHKVFAPYKLHERIYRRIREEFELSAQVAVRCLGKVADAYKLDTETQRSFAPLGAIAYDARILSWNFQHQTVSIWTLEGCLTIPFTCCGEHHADLLCAQKGECDLVERNGTFYLYATCDIPDAKPMQTTQALGVDLGIVNIATDSDGEVFSGAEIEQTRAWYAKRRATLQSVGTKSAKRRLKKLSGKQRRFQKNTNHRTAKTLVAKAKGTKRAIALEELKGIGKRVTVRKSQRGRHHNWAFAHLRSCIEYKAQCVGVPIILLDPRNSSRTCSACGHCDKANRRSQAEFVCVSCQHTSLADVNAAINLKMWAAVKQPMVSDGGKRHYSRSGTSHPTLAGGI